MNNISSEPYKVKRAPYLNPDAFYRFIGPKNRGKALIDDELTTCLLDNGAQLNFITPAYAQERGMNIMSYAVFEEFPKFKTKTYELNEVIVGTWKEIKNDPDLQDTLQCIENPIAPQQLKRLQQQDANIETLKHKLQHNKLDKEYYSLDENDLLTRKVVDGGHKFHAIYLPNVLVFQVLRTAHDDLGHNGFLRTYAALKRVFYWKGMKEDIRKHCKTCATCILHRECEI